MIRLVAADMDGTLLNDNKELSPETLPVIRALSKKGIRFVVASGRQYFNLLRYFAPVQEEISFICVNGALVYDGGTLVREETLPAKLLQEPLHTIRKIPQSHVVACGLNGAYTESRAPVFLNFAGKYFESLQIVDCFEDLLAQEPMVQLSVYHEDAKNHVQPVLLPFCGQLDIYLSEKMWVDIHLAGVDKGKGMAVLQQRYQISPDETMAFGDYLNDVELMQHCTHSVAMENAHPQLLDLCRYRAPSNNAGGVITVLKQYFDLCELLP